MQSRTKQGWAALLALWLVAGCRWLPDQQWPITTSTLTSAACACALGTVIAVLCTGSSSAIDILWRRMVGVAACGAVLFVGQVSGSVMHGIAGDEYNRAVALCLVPVIVIVARAALGAESMTTLWPGLAGLAGALLIFPLATGGNAFGYMGLAVPALLVGIACVVLQREAEGLPLAWSSAALLGGGAAGLGAFHWIFFRNLSAPEAIWQPLPLDTAVVGLTALALLLNGARRYSASYFAITAITIAGGAAVLRPGWTWRLAGGLLLMAAGAWGLTRRTELDTPGLGLAG